MALVRINRNGTFYQAYHVRPNDIELEISRLRQSGLTQLPESRQNPEANSFIVATSSTRSLAERHAHGRVA
jgi:hypothetical protein